MALMLIGLLLSESALAQMGGMHICDDECVGGGSKIGAFIILILLLLFSPGPTLAVFALIVLAVVPPFWLLGEIAGQSGFKLLLFPVWWYFLYLVVKRLRSS